jgi:uncharacterized membrane protein YfcA
LSSSLVFAVLVYLVTGCAAGYLAGLFGVGGGIIIVPVLTLVFEGMHFPRELTVQLAVGTSMATVTVTAIFSARTHHRNGNVDWGRMWMLMPVVLVGVVAGALVGASVPRRVLMACVLAFELAVAGLFLYETTLGRARAAARPERELPPRPSAAQLAVATVLGAVSSVVGIAGGTLFVPYLNLGGMGMRRAIGTAAALGVPIGLVAAVVYLITGLAAHRPLPPYSAGYIYLPAFAGCIVGGVWTSRHGANIGKRLDVRGLKIAFALVLLVAATKMALALRR